MSSKYTHIRDIRLYNNAGVALPVCIADAKLLDMENNWPLATDRKLATCPRCKRKFKERYAWALGEGED